MNDPSHVFAEHIIQLCYRTDYVGAAIYPRRGLSAVSAGRSRFVCVRWERYFIFIFVLGMLSLACHRTHTHKHCTTHSTLDYIPDATTKGALRVGATANEHARVHAYASFGPCANYPSTHPKTIARFTLVYRVVSVCIEYWRWNGQNVCDFAYACAFQIRNRKSASIAHFTFAVYARMRENVRLSVQSQPLRAH